MKKLKTIADQNARMHLIGRLWLIGGMLLICTIPLWLSLYYDVEPMWEVFGSAAVISPFILMALSGIAEPIVYSPMVGINGMYLSFLTGNLSNLKIPCVVKAQEIAGTKRGTEEDEIVATIAVATSSLVTILIIGVIVLCLAVIPDLTQKIDDAKYLTPAFGCVVYALFGSLGGKYIVKNPKLAIGPIIIVVIVSIVLGVVGMDPGSAYLFVGIAVCLVFAIWQMLREKKKLRERDELRRLEAIASGMSYEKVVSIETAQYYDAHPENDGAISRIALSEPLSWCSRTSVYAPLPDSGSFAHFIEISPSGNAHLYEACMNATILFRRRFYAPLSQAFTGGATAS